MSKKRRRQRAAGRQQPRPPAAGRDAGARGPSPAGTRGTPPPSGSGLPRWLLPAAGAAIVVIGIGIAGIELLQVHPGSAAAKATPVPHAATTPAPTVSGAVPTPEPSHAPASGQTVDGIQCQTNEQLLFHFHAHLAIVQPDGQVRVAPGGTGIPNAQFEQSSDGPFAVSGTCFYWLHAHAADGIIHIESPVQRTYTLGNLFAIWGQPLGADQAGPARGHVTVIYNGQVYRGNPRDVPLNAHAQIQLQVGTPLVAPVSISFPSGL